MTDQGNRRSLQLSADSSREQVAAVFSAALHGSAQEQGGARALIRANPETALKALNQPSAVRLTLRGAADIMDISISGEVDRDRASALITEHVLAETRTQLLQEGGDLYMAAASVLPLDDVLTAILSEVRDDLLTERRNILGHRQNPHDGMNSEVMLTLLSWAMKLKDRPDFEEFLNTPVDGYARLFSEEPSTATSSVNLDPQADTNNDIPVGLGDPDAEEEELENQLDEYEAQVIKDEEDSVSDDDQLDEVQGLTIRHYLIAAIWYDYLKPTNALDISAELFEDVGLDAIDAGELLGEMIENGEMPEFSLNEIAVAKLAVAKRRRQAEAAGKIIDPGQQGIEDLDDF
ncbi:MAG: hypothetical protein ABIH67_03585 [Candidatus Uhrbacteria bacterium]